MRLDGLLTPVESMDVYAHQITLGKLRPGGCSRCLPGLWRWRIYSSAQKDYLASPPELHLKPRLTSIRPRGPVTSTTILPSACGSARLLLYCKVFSEVCEEAQATAAYWRSLAFAPIPCRLLLCHPAKTWGSFISVQSSDFTGQTHDGLLICNPWMQSSNNTRGVTARAVDVPDLV